jgi:tight adherence protein B
MGALLGLAFGLGCLLVWSSLTGPWPRGGATGDWRPGWRRRTAELLAQAGLATVTPGRLLVSAAGVGLATALLAIAVSRSLPIGVAFGAIAAYSPVALVRYRARQRQTELRELWPEVIDNIASAIRAGMSLPEALAQVGNRGPEQLREPFQRFGDDYRATGRFSDCLDLLKSTLADPTGDRVVESLRLAREVGGTELGRLLRTLSGFLREDARTRAELEARQSWTVNAARLAVAAPWILLGLLSLHPEAVSAYNSALGFAVLAAGGGVCVVAYRLMLRLGRLPREERVLR